jgi:hypothetical protein
VAQPIKPEYAAFQRDCQAYWERAFEEHSADRGRSPRPWNVEYDTDDYDRTRMFGKE